MDRDDKDTHELHTRLSDDIAAGKTVVLSAKELDDPALRARLPQMLEDLARKHESRSLSPLRLPGYTMLGEIGRGGMSTVHLARHDALERYVAVKVTPHWLATDKRSRERLVKEARAIARVKHPNVIAIHDVIDTDDVFAIAMEWVDGHSLARLLRALTSDPRDDDMSTLMAMLGSRPEDAKHFEPTTTRHFVRTMRDIALAAQAVHDAGLLHLDIKPSNVLVRRDGSPLLADFGVVRDRSEERTHTHTFAGTPIYSAPEQLRRLDAQIGPHTDVYAIGLTLFELLTRDQPLRDLDLTSIVKTVESGRFPMEMLRAVAPPDLANIVQMAIAPEPANRYRTAEDLAADLTAFLENRPVTARPWSRLQLLRRWVRVEPWKATLAASLVLLLPVVLGLLVYLSWQWPQLQEIEQRERTQQANRLKNDAWLILMLGGGARDQADQMLESASRLEQDNTALTCLLMVKHFAGLDVGDVLDTNRERVDAVAALRVFRNCVAAGRSFFDSAEVRQLADSKDFADHFALATDRLLRATESTNPDDWQQATECVSRAILLGPPDELLYGMLTFCAAHTDDVHLLASSRQALQQRWSDSPSSSGWMAASMLAEAEWRGETDLTEVTRFFDEHPATWQLRPRLEFVRGGPWRKLSACEEALARDRYAPGQLQHYVDAASQTWARPTIATIARLFPRWMDAQGAMMSIGVAERQHLTESTKALLKENDRSMAVAQMADAAHALGNRELHLFLVDHFRQSYPDRSGINMNLVRICAEAGDTRTAAEVARSWRPPPSSQNYVAKVLMPHLATARDWPTLRDFAYWYLARSSGDEHLLAASYVGLAESRLGNHLAAAEHFAIALSSQLNLAAWTSAWMEQAWLYVCPEAPSQLHDQERAKYCMGLFDKLNAGRRKPFRGAWVHCVRASVALANRDPDTCRSEIEAADRFLARGIENVGEPDLDSIAKRIAWLRSKLQRSEPRPR